MKSKGKWLEICFIFMMILGLLIPQKAYAIDRLEENQAVTLEIDYSGNGTAVAGIKFKLYKVAEVSGFGEFELTGNFADYPLIVNNLDTEGWKILADTLESYVIKDQISPDDAGMTDENGKIQFPVSGETMTTGLYLVLGEICVYEGLVYTPEPTLISLPNRDVNDEWIYDVVIRPKTGIELEMTELQVLKIWKDNKNEKIRPAEIEVELLMDGEICDTVKLNKENNWRYEWENLAKGHDWRIVEKTVPEGYAVSISQDQTTYTITNTYKTTTPGTPSSDLPQTGVLWWPVPIFAVAGLLFFVIGWVRRQKSGE